MRRAETLKLITGHLLKESSKEWTEDVGPRLLEQNSDGRVSMCDIVVGGGCVENNSGNELMRGWATGQVNDVSSFGELMRGLTKSKHKLTTSQ